MLIGTAIAEAKKLPKQTLLEKDKLCSRINLRPVMTDIAVPAKKEEG
jgi:hypothetical protein